MPADAPPPVIITALPTPPAAAEEEEVYGPAEGEMPRNSQHCAQVEKGAITVCAAVEGDKYRLESTEYRTPTAMEELGDAIQFRIGPVEFLPGAADGAVGVGLRIRF